jgi:hypothetical protein
MSQRLPLDILVEQLTMLLRELTLTGGLLFDALQRPVEALQIGRAPKVLDLEERVREARELSQVLREILTESQGPLLQLTEDFKNQQLNKLAEEIPALQQEFSFWGSFADRAEALLKKVDLIRQADQITALGKAPIEESWNEVKTMAMGRMESR